MFDEGYSLLDLLSGSHLEQSANSPTPNQPEPPEDDVLPDGSRAPGGERDGAEVDAGAAGVMDGSSGQPRRDACPNCAAAGLWRPQQMPVVAAPAAPPIVWIPAPVYCYGGCGMPYLPAPPSMTLPGHPQHLANPQNPQNPQNPRSRPHRTVGLAQRWAERRRRPPGEQQSPSDAKPAGAKPSLTRSATTGIGWMSSLAAAGTAGRLAELETSVAAAAASGVSEPAVIPSRQPAEPCNDSVDRFLDESVYIGADAADLEDSDVSLFIPVAATPGAAAVRSSLLSPPHSPAVPPPVSAAPPSAARSSSARASRRAPATRAASGHRPSDVLVTRSKAGAAGAQYAVAAREPRRPRRAPLDLVVVSVDPKGNVPAHRSFSLLSPPPAPRPATQPEVEPENVCPQLQLPNLVSPSAGAQPPSEVLPGAIQPAPGAGPVVAKPQPPPPEALPDLPRGAPQRPPQAVLRPAEPRPSLPAEQPSKPRHDTLDAADSAGYEICDPEPQHFSDDWAADQGFGAGEPSGRESRRRRPEKVARHGDSNVAGRSHRYAAAFQGHRQRPRHDLGSKPRGSPRRKSAESTRAARQAGSKASSVRISSRHAPSRGLGRRPARASSSAESSSNSDTDSDSEEGRDSADEMLAAGEHPLAPGLAAELGRLRLALGGDRQHLRSSAPSSLSRFGVPISSLSLLPRPK